MTPQTAEYWIDKLGLQKHPEGGYFKEIHRSNFEIPQESLKGFSGKRNVFTSIYYLLKGDDFSAYHRIKSEEIWHFFYGSPLTIFILFEEGLLEKKLLGSNPDNQEEFQICLPANTWFAAKVNNPVLYSLVGCTVSPGFDFKDFELAKREELSKKFPDHSANILSLTR